jgi:hypothetical protein
MSTWGFAPSPFFYIFIFSFPVFCFVFPIFPIVTMYPVFVRLGPSPRLKLQLKGLDQSITLNSHIATTNHQQTFFQFQDTHPVENQYLISS